MHSVSPCFHLRVGFKMAQKDRAGVYINIWYAGYCLGTDSCESESDSDSDSDSNSDSGWLRFNLWLGFMMAQNDNACY